MSQKVISTSKAPQAIGPYSQAIQAGPWIFVSGQISLDPGTGKLIQGDVRSQTHRVMDNIQAILEQAGASMNQVVKCTIYLTDLDNFAIVNEIYGGFFQQAPPARATLEVSGLPKGVEVEIDAIAYIGN